MSIVRDLMKRFPTRLVRTGFGYGSSVFPQKGNDGKDRQIDMILIVDDVQEFHKTNMKINKRDYSYSMRFGGPEIVTSFNKRAAGLFFNPFVETDLGVLKYGVISTERAVDDLENWTSLYLSGRLHKPVKFCTPQHPENSALDLSQSLPSIDDPIGRALRLNLYSAIRTAIMLNLHSYHSKSTTLDDVLLNICKLSYTGDIRTQGFEDQQKVNKIFEGSYDNLKQLYEPRINEMTGLEYSNGKIDIDTSAAVITKQVENMPSALYPLRIADLAPYDHISMKQYLSERIEEIVKSSSTSQTTFNAITAGPSKSIRYAYAKLKKAQKSKQN
ncbi:Oidioi.mRNA.OKI2018_I69.PAR.g9312.t1.cds [Oikopleura dioica]|uniref:Phosphatidate cytidylyltransferase, mitochondrial n=1 Tax=Oikopleura dioica TaxID=34765 RepID=A0ABN7RK74_OIKDI|nr:Oidioi.mRNA.OKI2018_I69.PAR.g9312.t1.cds [Oikopleura dioica]